MTTLTALPETVRGLPLHVLVVHAVVVLVPLAAVGALASALWPAVRRHFGAATVVVAAIATALAPVATGSGENFERQLGAEELVRDHSEWGERVLPVMIVLLVFVLALVALDVLTRSAQVAAREPVGVGADGVGAVGVGAAGVRAGAAGGAAGVGEARPTPPLTSIDRRLAALFPSGARAAASAGKLRLVGVLLAVLVVVAALAALWVVFQTGESGARAAWGGR